MNASWSDDQRQYLQALGCTVFRLATGTHRDAVDASPAPANRGRDVAMAPPSAMGAARGAPQSTDPLVRGLMCAAHVDPARVADPAAWLRAQQIASLTQLRNNPAAKRALWPRLRALRCENAAR